MKNESRKQAVYSRVALLMMAPNNCFRIFVSWAWNNGLLSSQALVTKEMGCSNSGNKFEEEATIWLIQALYDTKARGRKGGNDFSWMMDHDYKGEMKSTARILGNSWGHLHSLLSSGTRVPETCTGRITNDSLLSELKLWTTQLWVGWVGEGGGGKEE